MKNAVSSSKILESQSNTEITNPTEQLELESTFAQSTTSNTANPRIFGKDSQKKAQKSHREQNYPKNTQSHDFKDNAHSPSLRDTALAVAWQSIATKTQPLESTFEKVDSSVDCHAAAHAVSRNDSKNADSNTAKSVGEIFICPIASSLSRLKGLEEFRGDFVSLDHACDKYTILAFYAQEFFKACDYCHDMAAPKTPIPIAVQTKATLELTR